ncbi:hypothetical protein ACFVAJ_05645 [Agromyces sp. NPDC057679]|uniref:hypothetical protein n=1 Tax=Agromyces sp. NPDC057679 TaxID=3346207 RepID=UPI00366CB375
MLIILVTAAVFFGTRLPASVDKSDLAGVWHADDAGGRIVLNADGEATLEDVALPSLLEERVAAMDGQAEWMWRLDRHAVRLQLQHQSEDRTGEFDVDAVTCGIDVCLEYWVDESPVTFRR